MKKRIRFSLSKVSMHFGLICFCALIVIPLLLVISISLTSEKDIYTYGYGLIPKVFDLSAYRLLFKSPEVLINAYKITIFISVVGTLIGLLFTAALGYCISRKDFRYQNILTFYVVFTMLFNGGLVAFFIVMTQYLKLNNSLVSMILPHLISPFYVIIMRGFMSDISISIIESAKIDGAKEWSIFFKIILPLAKPALATIGVFYIFTYWNEWFNAMLFISNDKKIPLQLLLARIMNTADLLANNPDIRQTMLEMGYKMTDFPSYTLRMATACMVAGPILLVFPFFQRYFVKGLSIGAVKG